VTDPTTPVEPAMPTTATVVADVHQVLDNAKAQATDAITAIEHLDFGHLAAEAKQLLHDAVAVLKEDIAKLFHRNTQA
jgi:hypothetical protein